MLRSQLAKATSTEVLGVAMAVSIVLTSLLQRMSLPREWVDGARCVSASRVGWLRQQHASASDCERAGARVPSPSAA